MEEQADRFGIKKDDLLQINILLLSTLPKIEFIHDGVGHDLLTKTNVLVGLDSVSLIEWIAAGKQFLSPGFRIDQIPF